jgi:uncharacterized protein
MWLILFLLLYLSAAFYVFFRLICLGVGKLLSALFVIPALAFPLCQILVYKFNFGFLHHLQSLLYYFLPYLLYLLMLMIDYDLLMGLNRFLKIIPEHITKQAKFRKSCLAALLIIPLIVEIYGIINYRDIKVNTYQVQIPAHKSSLEHLRIVVAADLHLQKTTPKNFMPYFVDMVNALEPDIVLLPGDITEAWNEHDRLAEFTGQFQRLNASLGIYGSFGNHEWYGDNKYAHSLFEQAGIHLLEDEIFVLDEILTLVGRNDNFVKNRMKLSRLLAEVPEHLPVILMDHKPHELTEVSKHKVDIQVSGHTHHGQLYPFNWITSAIFELSWGHKQINNTHFFVTSGIRGWGPQVRTSGDAEIMLIEVELLKLPEKRE